MSPMCHREPTTRAERLVRHVTALQEMVYRSTGLGAHRQDEDSVCCFCLSEKTGKLFRGLVRMSWKLTAEFRRGHLDETQMALCRSARIHVGLLVRKLQECGCARCSELFDYFTLESHSAGVPQTQLLPDRKKV